MMGCAVARDPLQQEARASLCPGHEQVSRSHTAAARSSYSSGAEAGEALQVGFLPKHRRVLGPHVACPSQHLPIL